MPDPDGLYQPINGKPPSDEDADQTYDRVVQLARQAGILVMAYGGVATIVIPRVQRQEVVDSIGRTMREQVLRTGFWELEGTTDDSTT